MRIHKHELLTAMANAGMSFKALASVSGVSRATLSYINNGKACRPETVGKLAKALGVPVEQLVEGAAS